MVTPVLPNTPTPTIPRNSVNNRPIHRRWEFANARFEAGVQEVVGVEGAVEVAEPSAESGVGVGGVGVELATFDVFGRIRCSR